MAEEDEKEEVAEEDEEEEAAEENEEEEIGRNQRATTQEETEIDE